MLISSSTANAALPPDFTNVRLSPTRMSSRLNTVLVVASVADPDSFGRSTAFMDWVAKTCAPTAPDSASTSDTRTPVCCGSAAPNAVSAASSAAAVTAISDAMDDTAPSRADVAFVSSDARPTSKDCSRLTSAERAAEFAETFKPRTTVAELTPIESELSAFCSNDSAVEIAELSD